MEYTNIRTEVLIIGGGLAGLMAAISARQIVNEVLIVSKGPVGKSGNTLVSGGGIASATGEPENGVEAFFNDIQSSAKGLNNPVLSRKLAEDSPFILEILEKFGVKLVKTEQGYKRRRPPGHSVPRNIPTDWSGLSYLNRGLSFTLPLLVTARELGIKFLEGVTILKLLKDGNRVVSALGTDRKLNLYHIIADSVVLASGGGGYLFQRNNNTRDIVGDSYALALEAGCSLQDMEQVQFYPTMMFKPFRVPISNPLFGQGAVLRNSAREQFMHNYDPAGDMATRDSMARAIFLEILAGRGIEDQVYVDCTKIDPGKLKEVFKDFYEFLQQRGIDPTTEYLMVTPCVHYFLGGIMIDVYCRTGVAGLYAAGEACGGIHGANRLSGAALMEACVFGWQAGKTAAEEKADGVGNISFLEFNRGKEPVAKMEEWQQTLRKAMWEKVSLIRNRRELEEVLALIKEYDDRLPEVLSLEMLPFKNMLTTAAAVILSALERRESRGAHYRSDYTTTDAAFLGNVICYQAGKDIKTEFMKKGDSRERA
jgi:aspartate oxidase